MKGPLSQMAATDTNKAPNPESTPSPSKKQEKQQISDLRNGKVVFKQKPISLEKNSETMQEIVNFREMLEERIRSGQPSLTAFPEEHKPLIAKLAHESDKSLAVLSKNIHQELLPALEDEDEDSPDSAPAAALPLSTVEDAIKSVLVRTNYGLDAPIGIRLPAAVCVWRWEVRPELGGWLPKNAKEKAETRQVERMQAKEHLMRLFEALPQDQRDAIIDPKNVSKVPVKESTPVKTVQEEDSKTPTVTPNTKKQGKQRAGDAENDQQGKKVQDAEKAAKEKERLEKKAARAEKERKEKEAQSKSKSLMATFFKTKPTASTSKVAPSATAGPSNQQQQSDFEKTFRPYILGKEKTMAPINHFASTKRRQKSRQTDGDVIVIDEDTDQDDIQIVERKLSEMELETMSPHERLRSILSGLPPSLEPLRLRKPNQLRPSLQYKTFYPTTVRDVMNQLSEAEIGGDDVAVRAILKKMYNRKLFPVKVAIFHTDTRPGYYGTWTRNSQFVGPRTPFAKEVGVDYACDSGAEWEEEPQGEDVADGEEEEDAGSEDDESDMDGWLVSDDEEPEVPIRSSLSPPPFDIPVLPNKRKSDNEDVKRRKKRKKVVPLVPFAKGPCWEKTIGVVEYEPFKPYRIQLFNDTPFPIDPFTYVSSCVEDQKAAQRALQQPSGQQPKTEDGFLVPPLPSRIAPTTTGEPKKPGQGKASFPDIHVDFLLAKITEMQATSIISLIEAIYLDLKEHKVKKNAIEAKVKEVAEKCKEKKCWVVKPLYRTDPMEVS